MSPARYHHRNTDIPMIEELAPLRSLDFIFKWLWHGKVTSHESVTAMIKSSGFYEGKNECLIVVQPNLSRVQVQ